VMNSSLVLVIGKQEEYQRGGGEFNEKLSIV